ncbi:DNA-binding transcriptional regulator, PadR family [Paenibacillus sp. UNCCL117]|uniref:PadR family transcriptional regulator n=1 Tax=unclassified Paenibacillus TaxID=185978 RepID=UPI00088B6765|nr:MULTISPECIES: PadR family transcriptional regulator [unclassified Paenibacillus]SDD71311.1 DNA-binding transcriptional regulator, PadR family [Paenibacillus sp. cl123]SFW45509.1 DNA-binding transcriptional regulator, PadR family [Paenibacillus sp. UNCCL117]
MSMKLVILGLLMEEDCHPYEMRLKMKERNMLHYIKMQEGSLYYAIETLEKSGAVEQADTEKDSSRQGRTVYRITSAGRQLFQELLEAQFTDTKTVYHPLYAALVFARYGDRERLYELLLNKVEEQRRALAMLREVYDSHIHEVSRSVLHMMKGRMEHAAVELRWLERLAADAAEDRLKLRGLPIED